MLVSGIHTSLTNAVSGFLGSDWTKLRYFRDLDKNDERTFDKGYYVVIGSGTPVDSVINSYTIDQDFDIILTRVNPRHETSDDGTIEIIKELHDYAEDIMQLLSTTNASNSNVCLIGEPSFSEPEILKDGKYINLTFSFIIKYRKKL